MFNFKYYFVYFQYLTYLMEGLNLKDPLNNRVVTALPLPPQQLLPTNSIFHNGKVDWQLLRAFIKK